MTLGEAMVVVAGFAVIAGTTSGIVTAIINGIAAGIRDRRERRRR